MTGDSDLAAGEGLFTGGARAGEGPGPEPPAGAPVEAEEAEGRGRGQGWAGSTGGLGGAAVWQGKQGSAPCPGPTGQLEAPAQRPLPLPSSADRPAGPPRTTGPRARTVSTEERKPCRSTRPRQSSL